MANDRGRRGGIFLLAVALAALLCTGTSAASPPWRGVPLVDALEELRRGPLADAGWSLAYSSALVEPGMRVLVEPVASSPRPILEELLSPHGLGVEEREPGALVVVRVGPAAGVVTGSVVGEAGAALSGARVTLLAPAPGRHTAAAGGIDAGQGRDTGADGAFTFVGVSAGTYGLMARAEGHVGRWVDVEVVAGEAREVRFRLVPRPRIDDEIVVRPSRYGLFDDAPGGRTVLDREEIDRLPHLGDDPFRLASLLPGTAGSDVSARFSVRGGRRDEVRVVVDGLEVFEPYHLRDYDGALSIVPARALEGMSLTTGAYPASRGDRMSGVLDLRTLRPPGPRLILGLGALDAFVAASGRLPRGSRGGEVGGGEAGDPGGDPGGWLVTARRGSLDLAGRAVGDEEPDFWDALAKVEKPTRLGRLAVRTLASGDGLVVNTRDDEEFERLDNEWRSRYVWVTHSRGGDRWLVETLASWGGLDRERRSAVEEEEGGFALFDRRDLDVVTLSQEVSWQASPRRLTRGGWEARRYRARFDYDKDLELDIVVEAPFSAPRSTRHAFDGTLESDDLAAWFSHREVAPAGAAAGAGRPAWLAGLTAELGLRYDRHGASDGTVWSPRLNLAWRLGEQRVLRLAWGRFTQSQRPYELQVEDGETRLWPVERASHWVLGYEALLGGGTVTGRPRSLRADSLRVELFHRQVDNPRPRYESLLEPLNFFPEVEPDRVRLAPESSTAYGAELLLQGRWGRRAHGFLSYTWSRSQDRLPRLDGRERVPRRFDQPHAVLLNVGWRLPGQWDLNLAWRFHTGWPTTPVESLLSEGGDDGGEEDDEEGDGEEGDDGEEGGVGAMGGAAPVARFGPLYSRRLPDYHRLDLRASRRWTLARGTLTFYIDIQNAYDRANLAGFDLAVDDGRLEREEESWPGLVPTAGLVLELGRAAAGTGD